MNLKNQKCEVCKVGAPPLPENELKEYMSEVDNWELYDNDSKIKKEFEFKNFMEAVGFINKIANIAEEAGHHPDIYLHNYKKVRIELFTHKINNLHKNDFILAAKIDEI